MYDTTGRAFRMQNVRIHPRSTAPRDDIPKRMQTAEFSDLVVALATKYPNWTFLTWGAVETCRITDEIVYRAASVYVYEGDEELGTIRRTYVGGARGNVYSVENKRIADTRERRRKDFQTKKPEQVLAKVKKVFSRKSAEERIAESISRTTSVIVHKFAGIRSTNDTADSSLTREYLTFVRSPEGQAAFLAYAERQPQVMDVVTKQKEAYADMLAMRTIREAYDKDRHILVIRDDEDYIVRVKQTVAIYTDDNFPIEWRAKLGLLKAVQHGDFIEDFGIRINDDVFVLINEEGQ